MKKTNKILSVFMALIMIISIIPMSSITASAADYSGTCGENLTWTFDEKTSTLTISGTGAMYNDYYYYAGSRPWDNYYQDIKNVVVGDNVTTIGDYAFYSHGSLEKITIGNSVTTIGDYAFSWCTSLASITIPDSVTSIGDYAFYDCTSLASVIIGDSVNTIGMYAFYYCDNLASFIVNSNNEYYSNDEYGVLFNKDKTTLIQYPMGNTRTSYVIPNSVVTIGDDAFFLCNNLTSVTLPNSVTTIGDYAFNCCASLTNVSIPDSVITIGNSAFYNCTNLENITIGNNVTSIGDGAFADCDSLTQVIIPESVTTIGDGAFRYCDSLTSIIIDSNNQYYSSDEYAVLFNKDKTTLIQYPMGNARTSYAIPKSVTTIGDWAFAFCDSLTSVTIPDSVITIGDCAFYACDSLTSVTIPDSVTTIGERSFACCDSIEIIIIGQGVESLGILVFANCNNLKSVLIPKKVTVINKGTFFECYNLEYVYYSGTEDDWNNVVVEDLNEPLNNVNIYFNVKNESEIFTFVIPEPSNTYLRNRDGIILHTAFGGNVPENTYVVWTSDNNNFKEETEGNNLKVIAKNNGYTTFTARLCDADGNVLAIDSVEIYSNSGFFDKIGGLFRSIFGLTKIYEY